MPHVSGPARAEKAAQVNTGYPQDAVAASRPWKTAKMSQVDFEALLEHVTPEAMDCFKREAEVETLLQALGLSLE